MNTEEIMSNKFREEPVIDELGRINIIPNNVYLIKDVNYSEYKSVYEWECLSKSETSYKFLDKITERIFWIEKDNFKTSAFGPNGYYVFECIYNDRKERNKILKQVMQK